MPDIRKVPIYKLGAVVICSIVTLLLPLQILSHSECILLLRRAGYWFILLSCGLFFWKFYTEFRKTKWRQIENALKIHWLGLILAVVVTGILLTRDATGFKILFDEHVLSATARTMHITQIAYAQAAGHIIDHEYVAIAGFTDKRPLLFPFLLSTLHNIAGYKIANVFVLNAILTLTFLVLLYSLTVRLCSRSYGILAVLLIGGLPLLAQNANGGGFEVLNLCLLAGLALTAVHYLKKEGLSDGLDLLIMVSVLLANVRYESLLYVLVPPAALLLKSLQKGKIDFTWFSALSPLLLITPLLSYRGFRDEPGFFQTAPENFLSIEHWSSNFPDALKYLFDWQGNYTNSILISTLGMAAMLCCLIYYGSRAAKLIRQSDSVAVFFPILLILLFNTLLALSNFWGNWTDPATSRFSLPLHFAMVVCTAIALHRILNRPHAPHWLMALSAGYFVIVSHAHCERMRHEFRMSTGPGYNWVMDWIRNESPPGSHLYIAESTTGIGLLSIGAIPLISANAMPEKVALTQELGFYDEIYFIEELRDRGRAKTEPIAHLIPVNERYRNEPVARYYISEERFYQISRMVELQPAKPGEGTLPADLPPTPPEGVSELNELRAYYIHHLPLFPAY